jgi:hypothetical protein
MSAIVVDGTVRRSPSPHPVVDRFNHMERHRNIGSSTASPIVIVVAKAKTGEGDSLDTELGCAAYHSVFLPFHLVGTQTMQPAVAGNPVPGPTGIVFTSHGAGHFVDLIFIILKNAKKKVNKIFNTIQCLNTLRKTSNKKVE